MAFADKYLSSLSASNLMDDAHHHKTEALQAAAIADQSARNIGSLLSRVKYHDGPLADQIANSPPSLTKLATEWLAIVTEKGRARKWVKDQDIAIAHILYRRVANFSLEHYLDGMCKPCGGTGAKDATEMFRACPECNGTREAKLPPMTHYEADIVRDMVGELEALESSHAGHASSLLRRDA